MLSFRFNNYEFFEILECEIRVTEANHLVLYYKGCIPEGKNYISTSRIGEQVLLWVKDDEREEKLIFNGILSKLILEKIGGRSICTLEANSFTVLEDEKKYTRVFQDTKKTVNSIIKQIDMKDIFLKSFGDKEWLEKEIPDILIQREQSNFSFLNYLCRELNKELRYSFSREDNHCITIGEKTGNIYKVENEEIKITKTTQKPEIEVTLYNKFYNNFDYLIFEDKQYRILKYKYKYLNGIMHCTYICSMEVFYTKNTWSKDTNLILRGTVVDNTDEAKLGRIKVVFKDDLGEMKNLSWVEVLSPFTSKGTGFHFSPQIGDEVAVVELEQQKLSTIGSHRVFPSDDLTDPKEHFIKNVYGQEIRLKEDLIRLTSIKDKLSLTLTNSIVEIKNGSNSILVTDIGVIIKTAESELRIEDVITAKTNNSSLVLGTGVDIKGESVVIEGNNGSLKIGDALKIKGSMNVSIESSNKVEIKGSKINFS